MTAALDGATDVGLDAVLASLLDSLATAPEQASVPGDLGRTADIDTEMVVGRDVGSVALDGVRPQEAFKLAAAKESVAAARRPGAARDLAVKEAMRVELAASRKPSPTSNAVIRRRWR